MIGRPHFTSNNVKNEVLQREIRLSAERKAQLKSKETISRMLVDA